MHLTRIIARYPWVLTEHGPQQLPGAKAGSMHERGHLQAPLLSLRRLVPHTAASALLLGQPSAMEGTPAAQTLPGT